MFIDALGLVSDAQAFGAGAVSTNAIDLCAVTPTLEIGTGEPLGFGVAIDVSGTVAPSVVEIISATDAALTAGILVHATRTIPLAEALAGSLWFLSLPPGAPTQRYLGLRITTAGGTITATAWLTGQQLFSLLAKAYPKGYNV